MFVVYKSIILTHIIFYIVVIEEGNWLTLVDDLEDVPKPEGGFDAVICLGNSFAHLPDFTGKLENQKCALTNFMQLVKPGGILVIDHRNYDEIISTGSVPAKNIYYNVMSPIKYYNMNSLFLPLVNAVITEHELIYRGKIFIGHFIS